MSYETSSFDIKHTTGSKWVTLNRENTLSKKKTKKKNIFFSVFLCASDMEILRFHYLCCVFLVVDLIFGFF